MPALLEKMEQLPESPETMLAWVAHTNAPAHSPDWLVIVGGLLLFWLAIELMRAGTDGPNRFGLAPE